MRAIRGAILQLNMTPRQLVAGYFAVQAAGVAAWWGMLFAAPATAAWFQPAGWPRQALIGFWLADGLLVVVGSAVAALAVARGWSAAYVIVYSVSACVGYAALYCLGVSIATDQAWIASAMMASMAGLSLAMAAILGAPAHGPATIRVVPMSRRAAALRTFAQTVVFWSVFLWILPKGIVELQQRVGWPPFEHAGQTPGATILFGLASLLGLWSAATMALRGEGTPLPTATAPKLVVTGPYRWVRNPMAAAGIVQGLAVGWLLGSVWVMGGAIAGAFVWHGWVRPTEEADLAARFGESFERYRKRVPLWAPRLRTPAGDS
ncbi:hypothetical protein Pla175_03460 [Pirellulimonas nuda]|uniref:Isoprenylcysteine carboxyl methyltransferase (ICMT) family protein n=1 Tax=Pirellulimonas nuda TaxID=2528009 RepID=A0A518D690_9BACT|nr:isoprenylcysteine carboxylmethyltransferase family protein [Pirellulimonas nuda]QDU86992.1 hypothetical protein Pla175_03460 [Pirellulimonas nuda]